MPLDAMGQITTFAFHIKKHYLSVMTKSSIQTRLMNKATDYLGRYATSQHRLREVLARFALRQLNDQNPDKIATAISATVERCQKLGYLDDVAYAQSQARKHRKQGRSKLRIRQRLRQHMLDDSIINAALCAADQHTADGELLAACRFARRRRIGPFDHRRYVDKENLSAVTQRAQRQLGSLARAGFSMAVSNIVIRLESMDAAEMLIDQLELGEGLTI